MRLHTTILFAGLLGLVAPSSGHTAAKAGPFVLVLDGEATVVGKVSLPTTRTKTPPIGLTVPVGTKGAFYDWVKASFNGGSEKKSGELHACDYLFTSKAIRGFFDASVTRIEIPDLDHSSKAPARLRVDLTPASTKNQKGSGHKLSATPPSKGKTALAKNFRVELDGLPTANVARVESLSWTPGKTISVRGKIATTAEAQISDLELTLSMQDFEAYDKYYTEHVIYGKKGELSGKIELTASDNKTVLAAVELDGLAITGLTMGGFEANSEALAKFTVKFAVGSARLE